MSTKPDLTTLNNLSRVYPAQKPDVFKPRVWEGVDTEVYGPTHQGQVQAKVCAETGLACTPVKCGICKELS